MRLALVGPTHPYKGGIAQHTTLLAHRLQSAGHQVRLESWSAQYPDFLYPGQQRVAAPELPPFPATGYPLSWRRPVGWWRLGRRLRGQDAVILVVVSPVQAPAQLGILRGLRGQGGRPRTLALCHNVLPHERRAVDRRLVRAVLTRVDAVLVHSTEQASLASGLTTRPVTVAGLPPHSPGGLDPAGAATRPVRPAGTSAGTSAPAEVRHRLLFFGLVRPYKGLDVLLRALAVGPPEVNLTVAGEFWGGTDAVRALVAELRLGQRVELRPGYVPAEELPSLFAAADAVVLPYRASTSSVNAYLAFEHGLPVVATRVGTMAEQVRDGIDGLLCEPDDVDGLATAIRRLYADGTLSRLRAAVRPADAGELWQRYLAAVESGLGAVRS